MAIKYKETNLPHLIDKVTGIFAAKAKQKCGFQSVSTAECKNSADATKWLSTYCSCTAHGPSC